MPSGQAAQADGSMRSRSVADLSSLFTYHSTSPVLASLPPPAAPEHFDVGSLDDLQNELQTLDDPLVSELVRLMSERWLLVCDDGDAAHETDSVGSSSDDDALSHDVVHSNDQTGSALSLESIPESESGSDSSDVAVELSLGSETTSDVRVRHKRMPARSSSKRNVVPEGSLSDLLLDFLADDRRSRRSSVASDADADDAAEAAARAACAVSGSASVGRCVSSAAALGNAKPNLIVSSPELKVDSSVRMPRTRSTALMTGLGRAQGGGTGGRRLLRSDDQQWANLLVGPLRSTPKSPAMQRRRARNIAQEHMAVCDDVHSWNYRIFALDAAPLSQIVAQALAVFARFDFVTKFGIELGVLEDLCTRILGDYRTDVPYHNALHGLDVMASAAWLIEHGDMGGALSEVEIFALFVGCLGHDCGHPGHNNEFEVNCATELAAKANNEAVLEKMHLERTEAFVRETRIFAPLAPHDAELAMSTIRTAILATDMGGHFALLKRAGAMGDIFNRPIAKKTPEERRMLVSLITKASDISNPTKHPSIALEWARRVHQEFFAQGDEERRLGFPVPAVRDRAKAALFQSQINFCSIIVRPLYTTMVRSFPTISCLLQSISSNVALYETKKVVESEQRAGNDEIVLARIEPAVDDTNAAAPITLSLVLSSSDEDEDTPVASAASLHAPPTLTA